ncbi:glutamine amidotransferase-related protein [Lactococcus cremoris]
MIISPGPTPKEALFSREVVQIYAGKLPLLGICLGQQCLPNVFGGQVISR